MYLTRRLWRSLPLRLLAISFCYRSLERHKICDLIQYSSYESSSMAIEQRLQIPPERKQRASNLAYYAANHESSLVCTVKKCKLPLKAIQSVERVIYCHGRENEKDTNLEIIHHLDLIGNRASPPFRPVKPALNCQVSACIEEVTSHVACRDDSLPRNMHRCKQINSMLTSPPLLFRRKSFSLKQQM